MRIVESNQKVVYSSLVKPPHCNVHEEVNDWEYGVLINVIRPKYWLLGLKTTVLFGVLVLLIRNMMTGEPAADLKLDTNNPISYMVLIPLVIILGYCIYHVWLMTRSVYLYTYGFVINGIGTGSQRHSYTELLNIEKTYEYEQYRHQNHKDYIKMMLYQLYLPNGKKIKLRKRHYSWLKSKLEDLRINMIHLK